MTIAYYERSESHQGYALPKILELMRLSLKIVKTTFQRLSISNVIPTDAGFERNDLKHLKDLLLNYIHDKTLPEDIQCSAGAILVAGLEVIYIESSERAKVVTDALEKLYSSSDNSKMTKGVFAYTTNILKRYGNNVIDLLPRGHEYCTAKQAEEYTKPLSKFFVFGVESSLLIIKSGGSKINDISKNNNNVNSHKSRIRYSIEISETLDGIVSKETSRHTAVSRVVLIYGELLEENA